MSEKDPTVYIMGSVSKVLYTGVTSNLSQRIWQHKEGAFEKSFTKKYRCHRLLYFEKHKDMMSAIAREKQIQAYSRKKKESLIYRMNPGWEDLSSWYLENFQ